MKGLSPLETCVGGLDTLSSIKKNGVQVAWRFEWIINEFIK